MISVQRILFSSLLLAGSALTQANTDTDINGTALKDYQHILNTYKPRLEKGERLVKQQCDACHGANASSHIGKYPKLSGQHYEYMVKQLFAFKTNQRKNPYMQKQLKTLSMKELANAAYYYSIQKPVTPGTHENKVK
ncbi:cytochrome c [Candidatus Sororendozoicomonas aggregata]|uniref:c-type cytochrome n=1 Tax=Candidatus Sororendozoicomonas aggregata TaxID=3073239 RepID=UPI002ED567A3